MPSEKVLEQKKQMVADLVDSLNNSVAGVVVDYKGINVADDTKLRKELREAGVKYSVVKNTLLGLAAKGAGLDDITNVLEGTTAIAISPQTRPQQQEYFRSMQTHPRASSQSRAVTLKVRLSTPL